MQSIDSIKTYAHGTSKDLVSKKEEINIYQYDNKSCNNIVIQKKINFDDVVNEETKENNSNCPEIPDHAYIILIGGSGSRKSKFII